jgi:FixJ family two-component response regulator
MHRGWRARLEPAYSHCTKRRLLSLANSENEAHELTPAAAPTVFVVDDDELVRAAIQGMLKSVGLRSETFGTAQEFLRSKRPDCPSCLVLDVRLPGINGLEFQRELAGAGIRIPIIFVTGHAQ